MGWGITLSGIFAQFGAPDLVNGVEGEDYGVGTDMENWGMVTIGFDDELRQTQLISQYTGGTRRCLIWPWSK